MTIFRYLAYAFLLSVYALFAWYGKTSVDGFIATLIGMLSALGTSHIAEKAALNAESPSLSPPKG
jgi:ABC-type multidrug transport system permease subunit